MNPILSFVQSVRRFVAGEIRRKPVRRSSTRLNAESLEARAVPAALSPIRSYDGTGNNVAQVSWGAAGTDFLRVAVAEYGDGISTPAGSDRPSARVVSNAVSDQTGTEGINDRMMSAMVYAWGQFLDHDLDLTNTGTTEKMPIAVPAGDPSFDPNSTGTKTIPLSRSIYDAATGTSTANPRQQINDSTAWIDGSMVYGSNATTAASLRTFSGGKMKTSAGDLLPMDAAGNFLAGDGRVNENPELTSIQTLFVREHNRLAAKFAAADPRLTDEQIFQKARAFVIAEIQSITYNEWLPALLGSKGVTAYRGYDARVNPGIANEFATAGYRFGHSTLVDDIQFLGNDGTTIAEGVTLAEAFFNPELVKANGIDSLLKYLASDPTNEVDTKIVDSVRNFLFGAPGSGGLDLAALNIQRGRDHGLADYNTTRAAYGLPKVTSFAQITKNTDMQAKLQALYGSVDNIDLWVGALAEDHVPGGSVGPTNRAIIVDQFTRLRNGDRFWYQKSFGGRELADLEKTTFTDLIRRNTSLTTVQNNAFFFKVELSGTAFNDRNQNARRDPGERGLAGVTINLVDADTGETVSSTTTNARGEYKFDASNDLRTGRYRVEEVLPAGTRQTTPTGKIYAITGGDQFFTRADFGSVVIGAPVAPPMQPSPGPQPTPPAPPAAPPRQGPGAPPPQAQRIAAPQSPSFAPPTNGNDSGADDGLTMHGVDLNPTVAPLPQRRR